MKAFLILVAAVASLPAAAQTTNCYVNGQWVNCTTTAAPSGPSPQYPQPDNSESIGDAFSRMMAERNARKADAYARVGELIGRGDCAGANRLASFYGDKKLMQRTRESCPPQ